MTKSRIPEEIPLWERNEGARLFQTCLKYGATPGQVHKFLLQQLEKAKMMCKIECSGGCPECSPEDHDWCTECGLPEVHGHKMDCSRPPYADAEIDVVDEDWLVGVSCNPNAPEECESCQ